MATAIVWTDQYKGPRYTYYSPYRPITGTNLPSGYTVVLGTTNGIRHITVTERLPDRFVSQWSLEMT